MLSVKNGYYDNKDVKIPFPPEVEIVKQKLNKIGLEKQVNEVVLSINRAAEDAVSASKPLFVKAIKDMSISNAKKIITDGNTSGTNYLESKTTDSLIMVFKPIIENSLDNVNATKYWNEMMKSYNKIPFSKKVNTDLAQYVTEEAIMGMFKMISKEEIAIRDNPSERTTKLLKKVFNN